MSGPARRRGGGRATGGGGGGGSSETSSRRGDRLQVPGGFDGPASRGTASGTGSQGRRASNAPSVGSGRGSPNPPQGGFAPQSSQAPSQASAHSQVSTQPQTAPMLQGDPARENQPRYTDSLRNIDLPASFYGIDKLVSASSCLKQAYISFPC
jgi:hypothetical protein